MTITSSTLAAATVGLEPLLHFDCELCGAPLEPVEFTNGGSWSVRGLAMRGRRKFKSVLCWSCYVRALRAARGAGGTERSGAGRER